MLWKIYCLALVGVCSGATIESRRARQLDLSPAPAPAASPRDSSFQQAGYLPPTNEISPAGAQNDVTVLRPTEEPHGPTHHGRDLCTDPFHSFLCATLKPRRVFTGARQNSIEGANSFNVPSKVLAPPLNDLEELPIATPRPTTTTPRPTTTTPRPTTTTPRPTTTTPRPTTTTPRPTTTTQRPKPTTTTTTAPDLVVGPAASSDVRTYLPPDNIAPAAASNDPAILPPEDHDHHHPHHHGRDLCTDPFHSFLCQPLKPRKRISGDLPNHLQGQSSFEAPLRIKPEPEVKPQPSNTVNLAYLPPSTTRRPVTTTIRTTPFRRISPQPSNDINRIYLPPVTTTRRPPPPPPPTTPRRPPPPPPTTTLRPEPSNVQNSYLPPSLPEPTNINNNYLPPDPKLEPAAASNDPAVIAPDHDHHHGSHGFKDICSDPFHSFLCTVPKTRTRITGALPDRLKNLISPAPSNVDETRIKPVKPTTTTERIIPQPDTLVTVKANPDGYNYPKPVKQFPLPSENQPSKVKGYDYPKPDVRLTLPSEIKIAVVPTTTTPRPTTPSTTPKRIPTTTTTRRPPTTLQPAASNEIKGYEYPKPAIKFPPPQKGYDYPKPEVKLTLPSENKPVGYDYPKPVQPFTEATKGYDYPKPTSQFSLPTQQSLRTASKGKLPGSIQEARERLQSLQGKESVQKISNISTQNESSDLITVNHVQFNSGFGERLQRRVRKGRNLVPPPGSHPF